MPGSTKKSATGLKAVQLGIVAGFFACFAYPVAAFAHPPRIVTSTLVACFGPALGIACYGLQRLIDWEAPLVSSALGSLLNALAGALYTAMGLLQLAVGYTAGSDKVAPQFIAIWLGLDVACDAFVGFGTICFSIAMLHHPRFGRVFSAVGILIGGGLLALHLYTFPTPPQNAGLVDLGPALGLWYLVVTIQMWRSLKWARGITSAT